MAERRMFAKTIVLSDAFLDMPLGARCLYMTMGMLADDDGFINNPKAIIRQCGATDDDMRVLIAKRFVLPFDSGVLVIKHWRINNYLRTDRYVETKYTEEKKSLNIGANGAYTKKEGTFGIPSNGIPSIGKVSIGKDRLYIEGATPTTDAPQKSTKFTKPTLQQVQEYCTEKCYTIDTERFYDYYESNGWRVGKAPMKDWKASARNWYRRDQQAKRVPDFTLQENEEELTDKDRRLLREVFGVD